MGSFGYSNQHSFENENPRFAVMVYRDLVKKAYCRLNGIEYDQFMKQPADNREMSVILEYVNNILVRADTKVTKILCVTIIQRVYSFLLVCELEGGLKSAEACVRIKTDQTIQWNEHTRNDESWFQLGQRGGNSPSLLITLNKCPLSLKWNIFETGCAVAATVKQNRIAVNKLVAAQKATNQDPLAVDEQVAIQLEQVLTHDPTDWNDFLLDASSKESAPSNTPAAKEATTLNVVPPQPHDHSLDYGVNGPEIAADNIAVSIAVNEGEASSSG
jgi:hypothetical protein